MRVGPAGQMRSSLTVLVRDLPPPAGHRERGVDPAVEVQRSTGHSVSDTADGISNVLLGSHQQHADQENHEADPVVQLEGEIVNDGRVSLLDIGLDRTHNPVHPAALLLVSEIGIYFVISNPTKIVIFLKHHVPHVSSRPTQYGLIHLLALIVVVTVRLSQLYGRQLDLNILDLTTDKLNCFSSQDEIELLF